VIVFQIDLKKSADPSAVLAGTVGELQLLVRPFAPLIGVAVGLMVLFSAVNHWIDGSVRDHEAQVAGLEASVAESKQQLAQVSGKIRVLYETQRPEIFWSDELRLLSEKLPDKVWLTQVRATSPQTTKGPNGDVTTAGNVMVEGGVLSNANEGNLDVIGKFVKDLQADARFQTSFSSIDLESVQRAAQPYTMTFRLKLGVKS